MENFQGEKYTARLREFIDSAQAHHGTGDKNASTRKLARLSGDKTLQQRIYYWRTNTLTAPISDYVCLALIDPKKRTPLELKCYIEGVSYTDNFSECQLIDIISEQHRKLTELLAA